MVSLVCNLLSLKYQWNMQFVMEFWIKCKIRDVVLFIYLFVQGVFIEYLVYVMYCISYWEYRDEKYKFCFCEFFFCYIQFFDLRLRGRYFFIDI